MNAAAAVVTSALHVGGIFFPQYGCHRKLWCVNIPRSPADRVPKSHQHADALVWPARPPPKLQIEHQRHAACAEQACRAALYFMRQIHCIMIKQIDKQVAIHEVEKAVSRSCAPRV